MVSGLKISAIAVCLAIGLAGCNSSPAGMAANPTMPSKAISTDDGTASTSNAAPGVGGTTMQQCNVIKSRVASGSGMSDSQTALIPVCERMLGTSLRANAMPTPVGGKM